MGGRRARLVIGLVVVSALGMAGCRASGSTASGSAPAVSSTSSAQASIPVASGHGWARKGLDGTVPAPGSCHIRAAADVSRCRIRPVRRVRWMLR
jgi:hypothetical protein